MDYRIIIPARYGASRLPGKPLIEINGKTMIQRVYQQACQTQAKSIVIATEDERIKTAAQKFGAEVCLTRADHPSGTDRIAEVTKLLNYQADEIIVNVQGDQPFIPYEIIDQVAYNLGQQSEADVATLCEVITDQKKLNELSVAKVVIDQHGYALYFSRNIIPWSANINLSTQTYYQHIGLYAYRTDFIQQYVQWPICSLEQSESLEQLRILWQGKKIHVAIASKNSPPEINTPEDVQKAQDYARKELL